MLFFSVTFMYSRQRKGRSSLHGGINQHSVCCAVWKGGTKEGGVLREKVIRLIGEKFQLCGHYDAIPGLTVKCSTQQDFKQCTQSLTHLEHFYE